MRALRAVVLPAVLVGVVCVVVAAVLEGGGGALGAAAGAALVVVFLGSTPLVLTPVVRASPMMSLPAALGFYFLKAAAAFVLLALLFDVGSFAEDVHRQSLGITAAVVSLAWTALALRGFRRERVPTYDLRNSDGSGPDSVA